MDYGNPAGAQNTYLVFKVCPRHHRPAPDCSHDKRGHHFDPNCNARGGHGQWFLPRLCCLSLEPISLYLTCTLPTPGFPTRMDDAAARRRGAHCINDVYFAWVVARSPGIQVAAHDCIARRLGHGSGACIHNSFTTSL